MRILKAAIQLTSALFLCIAPLGVSAASFLDDFETYANGSSLHGQSGWAGWDNTSGATAYASSDFAYSGLQSVRVVGASDLTHNFTGFTSGQATISIWQYLPNSFTGTSYLIFLNTYNHGGPYAWSVQINANASTGLLTSDNGGGATLPFTRNQWMEFRFDVNLSANTVSEYYNNQLLSTHAWYDTQDVTAVARIHAVDLFGNGAGDVYYDRLSISVVPEPASLSLLALGGLALAAFRRASRA